MADLTQSYQRMVDAKRRTLGGSSNDSTTAARSLLNSAHAAKAARKDLPTELRDYIAYANTVLVDAPIGYWRLNETAGPFLDSSGGGFSLTAGSGVTFSQAGATGSDTAAKFDGTTNGIASRVYDPFGGLTACSIEAWVNHQGVAWNAGGVEQLCNPSPAGHYLGVNVGFLRANLFISGVQRSATGGALPTSGWVHCAMTWATGDTIKVYINGEFSAQSAAFSGSLDVNAGGLLLAGFNLPAPASLLTGVLDEVAIYNTQLSAAAIAAHYAAR